MSPFALSSKSLSEKNKRNSSILHHNLVMFTAIGFIGQLNHGFFC